ncbi:hypothetical protein BKN38_06535 [Helicobacter sp. CLO-3]|uniref:AAA domain-containing protein n=1 Tax=unclassified Helicobacter TaxID=2593540 RepID=UPI00080574A2|nr:MULTISPECIES: AAA domain-containing protein [unclassified Helicobacter]OBV30055.1 hypothetical protein BA723_02925 [Helicobacter sp. CLO-3]OHU82710.1 hypothetical protein BKN38_06535 [Helicobacter sp. CLO-3]
MQAHIKAAALHATSIYYDYLDSHNLGCEQIQILSFHIDDNVLHFHIKAKFLNTDSLMIEVDSSYMPIVEDGALGVLFYDEKASILAIECYDEKLLKKLRALQDSSEFAGKVKLFSDLKFLIQNLEAFFEESSYFALPSKAPLASLKSKPKVQAESGAAVDSEVAVDSGAALDSEVTLDSRSALDSSGALDSGDNLDSSVDSSANRDSHSALDSDVALDSRAQNAESSPATTSAPKSTPKPAPKSTPKPTTATPLTPEQQRALNTIFANPFSYIWGAPGSGKTQAVLFEALLHYIYSGVRVCVLAPTNAALEQVLKALIKKFDALGLNREKLLRLGTPSNAFLEQFVEVCDPQFLQKKKTQSLFSATNPKTRLKESLVIGMTMDGFIKRYKTLGVEFGHIFLDECAFTPLIKALTLTTQSAPITLLGDHKQLMPICEMPPKEIKGEAIWANLFNLSSLFLEDFFKQKPEITAPIFQKTQFSLLEFSATAFATLRKTHRYGDNLAKILDRHIYQNGLRGNAENTELYYIDCGGSEILDKQNLAEARMIATIIASKNKKSPKNAREKTARAGDLNASGANTLDIAGVAEMIGEDFAIITPFVRQRKLLAESGVPYKHIHTIHGSQGQEFESVIFSPVMLHHHLTDSRNKNAAHALNVAISRIKKRLIIVCDYAYWMRCGGQFLSEILRYAKPLLVDSAPRAQSVESKNIESKNTESGFANLDSSAPNIAPANIASKNIAPAQNPANTTPAQPAPKPQQPIEIIQI